MSRRSKARTCPRTPNKGIAKKSGEFIRAAIFLVIGSVSFSKFLL
jgi:hypothetical protein